MNKEIHDNFEMFILLGKCGGVKQILPIFRASVLESFVADNNIHIVSFIYLSDNIVRHFPV